MRQGYVALDPGHRYGLMSLDGKNDQALQFVKRYDPDRPNRFPRNAAHGGRASYPGTTLQCVVRALADRIRYLDGQKPCVENQIVLSNLQSVLWLLEKRAARRHGESYDHSPEFAMNAPVCSGCGHTVCPD